MNSPTKPEVAGRPVFARANSTMNTANFGMRVDHAAVGRDLAAVHAVVHHADAKEQRAGHEAVRDHLHHRALACRAPRPCRLPVFWKMSNAMNAPSVTKPMCAIDEYAMSFFMSC